MQPRLEQDKMKKCFITCASLFLLSFQSSAQTYLNCDFSQGIPAEFTLIDNDGLTPSVDMQNVGFKVGTPWITSSPKGESNPAACSTSWYAAAGQSDDWMISPAFTVDDTGAVLSWRAMAGDKRHRDGYKVFISTSAGTNIGDFDTAAPLYFTDQENASWTKHQVSLDAYKGKKITIAFVNNSTDKSRLYIDDIFAGISSEIRCHVNLTKGTPNIGYINVSGTAYTNDDVTLNGYDITLTVHGESFTQHFDSVISQKQPHPFTLDKKINIGKYQTVPYEITISSGNQKYTVNSQITCYQRKIVCEEGTGTWCGWCVRGLVYVDSIKKNAKDWAVAIAAHSADVMESSYTSAVSKYFGGGYPTGTINRLASLDPSKFFSAGATVFNHENILVDIDLKASLDTISRTVNSMTTLHFAADNTSANYGLAYAIIENNVHKDGNGGVNDKYKQHNSYANGEAGVMGGYEKYGNYIPGSAMYYQCVARGYVDNLLGIDGSVPSSYKADEAICYQKDFTLPDNIMNDKNTALIVMLIDKTDGHIVNAQQTPLGENEVTGIQNVVDKHTEAVKGIYSLDGHPLQHLQHGMNIIRMSNGKVTKIFTK